MSPPPNQRGAAPCTPRAAQRKHRLPQPLPSSGAGGWGRGAPRQASAEDSHPKCPFHVSPSHTDHEMGAGGRRGRGRAEARRPRAPLPQRRRGRPESSGKRDAPARPRPRRPRATPRRARPPAGPGPGRRRRPPFLPAAPHGPPATAAGGRTHIRPRPPAGPPGAARGLRRGEKKGPVSAPRPGAPPGRPPARRPRGASPRRDPAPASAPHGAAANGRTRGGVGGAAAAVPPGELGATYPPSCGRPLLLGLPGIRGYMERREPGSRWTRAGGAARRRDGPAGARARGGPRARDWAAGGAAPGRRGWAGAAGPGPRPASPVGSGRHRGGRRSLLPPPSLPARPGPAARAHTLGRRRPRAEQRTELPPARDPALVAGAGQGPPRPDPLYWVTASSAAALLRGRAGVRCPAPPPRVARTRAAVRGLAAAEGPTLRAEEAPPPARPGRWEAAGNKAAGPAARLVGRDPAETLLRAAAPARVSMPPLARRAGTCGGEGGRALPPATVGRREGAGSLARCRRRCVTGACDG